MTRYRWSGKTPWSLFREGTAGYHGYIGREFVDAVSRGGAARRPCGRLRTMNDPGPVEKKRRWWKVLAGALLLLLALIAAIPWGLAPPPGQGLLLPRANRTLRPGAVTWAA